jgi:N-dimethylarginine dimethylaminohydrolase
VIRPSIKNETGLLRKVVLGLAEDFGGVPALNETNDPKSKEHILNGTFPSQEAVSRQMNDLRKAIEKYDVEVLYPTNIVGLNQIFSRDIGFVLDEVFVVPNITLGRRKEVEALAAIIEQIPSKNLLRAPEEVRFEGGDILPWNEALFVGYSKKPDFDNYVVSRTNEAGVDFLKENFTNCEIIAVELKKSDNDPRQNALHLDCIFQPIGTDKAIVFKDGFKYESDYLKIENYFGADNLIQISRDEMYHMNSNIFSISPSIIISGKSFTRLNKVLRELGFTVEEVEYDEISKMEGLFRCSTLPLVRE